MSLADVVAFFQSKQAGNAGNVAVTPSLPKNINKIKAVTPVTPVTQENNDTRHEIESVLPVIEVQPLVNVPEALDRPMHYLIRADDSLPGLCLFSRQDIEEVETGVLPLDNAKRYLEKMEREHPHLGEIRQPSTPSSGYSADPVADELRESITDLTGTPHFTAKSLGRTLKYRKDRVVRGLVLRMHNRTHVAGWWVDRAGAPLTVVQGGV